MKVLQTFLWLPCGAHTGKRLYVVDVESIMMQTGNLDHSKVLNVMYAPLAYSDLENKTL